MSVLAQIADGSVACGVSKRRIVIGINQYLFRLLRVMRLWSCGQPGPKQHRRE
jgi:hypothetical protein